MADEEEEILIDLLLGLGVVALGGIYYPKYGSVEARLDSFKYWPYETIVSAQSLVEKGFFYTGVKDCTKCFYCDNELKDWEVGDDPLEQHEKWFPGCGNIFLCQENSQYGGDNKDDGSQSDPEGEEVTSDFISVQEPGVEDCTRCFYCGNELKDWEVGDNPLEQHEKWFPGCGNIFLCQENSQYGGDNKKEITQLQWVEMTMDEEHCYKKYDREFLPVHPWPRKKYILVGSFEVPEFKEIRKWRYPSTEPPTIDIKAVKTRNKKHCQNNVQSKKSCEDRITTGQVLSSNASNRGDNIADRLTSYHRTISRIEGIYN